MPKKETPVGKCERCGDDFNLWPKNRKYCAACQVIRDLRNGISARKCETCGDEYWPVRQSHKECYLCSDWRPSRPDRYPKCGQCGHHYRPAPGVDTVCCYCVTQSEEMRDRYLKSIKIRRRKAMKEGES